jgi:hypothetical protein
MAYSGTEVPISRSQDHIRKLVMAHKGAGIIFVSQPPKEGFEALVTIQDEAYHVRVMATCKARPTESQKDQELRRVWRVLFFHLKAMFEAADSGVIAIEDIILPYIVTPDNRTIGEHVRPKLAELRSMNPERILQAGGLK